MGAKKQKVKLGIIVNTYLCTHKLRNKYEETIIDLVPNGYGYMQRTGTRDLRNGHCPT